MRYLNRILVFALLIPLSLRAQEDYRNIINTKTEYTNPRPYEVKTYPQINSKQAPKNIIFLIGDGMGLAQVYASMTANHGQLFLQNLKYMGISKTHSADDYTTDSAAGGTALSCGKKTYNGAIGVDADTVSTPSILEQAEKKGKATGMVVTCSVAHATPGVFVAHQPDRNLYEAIAAEYLNSDIDLFIGGGYNFFAKRKTDKRNLVKELEDKNYTVLRNLDEAKNFTQGNLTILADSFHMPEYKKRGDFLPEATEKAIEILNNNSKEGFFLMVEGSQIDWGGHYNDISYIINETLDFDRAIGKALEFAAKDGNTLVIVTADHETGGVSIETGDIEKGYVKARFATNVHTGIAVPVFTYGPGAESFIGFYENTEIYHKMAKLWNIE